MMWVICDFWPGKSSLFYNKTTNKRLNFHVKISKIMSIISTFNAFTLKQNRKKYALKNKLPIHCGMFSKVLFRCENIGRLNDSANFWHFLTWIQSFFKPICKIILSADIFTTKQNLGETIHCAIIFSRQKIRLWNRLFCLTSVGAGHPVGSFQVGNLAANQISEDSHWLVGHVVSLENFFIPSKRKWMKHLHNFQNFKSAFLKVSGELSLG